MRRELTAGKAQALLARIRPGDDVARIRLQPAEDHLADIRDLDARLKTSAAQISDLAAVTGTSLTSLFGVGVLIAGRILAETGDVSRFATKDKFASCNGTAPTGVSSGGQVRHRLSRAGNRRTSHAVHMMAVTQIRYPWTDGRRYYERKRTEGKTPRKRSAASSAGSPTRPAVSSCATGRAQSKSADHLRPGRRRRLRLPHRRTPHPRPHHHPRHPARGRPGVRP
jgi:transposase